MLRQINIFPSKLKKQKTFQLRLSMNFWKILFIIAKKIPMIPIFENKEKSNKS